MHLCSFSRLARMFFSVSARNSTSRRSSRSRSRRAPRSGSSDSSVSPIGSNSSLKTALEISTHFVRSIYHYRPLRVAGTSINLTIDSSRSRLCETSGSPYGKCNSDASRHCPIRTSLSLSLSPPTIARIETHPAR